MDVLEELAAVTAERAFAQESSELIGDRGASHADALALEMVHQLCDLTARLGPDGDLDHQCGAGERVDGPEIHRLERVELVRTR